MRFLKFLLALFLLPTVFFVCVETGRILISVLGHFRIVLAFVAGAGVYAGVHYTLYDFSRPYVLVHEFTHALVAFLFGARVKDISIKRESGYVKMDKTNVLIVLAPYMIPGYTLLTLFLYFVGDLFVDLTPYRTVFLFFIGFFTSFHFIQTVKTLVEAEQPDLKLAGGKIFSLVLIILANLIVLAWVLKGLFPEQVSLVLAGENVLKSTLNVWRILVNYIMAHVIEAL